MKKIILLLFVTLAALSPLTAGENDPLFINLTSDDSHRAKMAIMFGKNQSMRGHSLTIYLNDKAVIIASSKNSKKYSEHQQLLKSLIEQGATVIVCPMCMKQYKVSEKELLAGVKTGTPELTGGQLFKENTKALSW